MQVTLISGRKTASGPSVNCWHSWSFRTKADAKIDQLSGGMKHRLLLARSLVNNPEILILDEPTTGLDPHSRRAVWDKLN